MKNLKVVFASLLIAAMGIVGFSSFTTTNKKAVEDKVAVWDGAWSEGILGDEANCPTGNKYCAIVYPESMSFETATGIANGVTPNGQNGTDIGSGVLLYTKP